MPDFPKFHGDAAMMVYETLTIAEEWRRQEAPIAAGLLIERTSDQLCDYGVGRQTFEELVAEATAGILIDAVELELLHG